jgi:hypothetical protein
MCLMMTADHGPAVSGAHNTIVASMNFSQSLAEFYRCFSGGLLFC